MGDYFNYNMVLLARQLRRMNQSDLAKSVEITQGQLSKIENGLAEPSESIMQKIADVLNFPIEYFYQPDRIYGLPLSFHHRKKASVGQHSLECIYAEINIRLMHLRRLLQSVKLSKQFIIPQIDLDEYDGDTERVADLIRRTWLLPPGPLNNLTECIEQAGGIVIWCDFSNIPVDGVSYYSLPDLPPCIFINRNQTADRMRFTLAHELGHLVMHNMPTNEMEKEANEFASALLMPARDIRASLTGRVSLPSLAALKPVWKVSIQALVKRSSDLGIVTYNQARYLWQQINSGKIKYREPPELDIDYEEPALLENVFQLYFNKLGYSLDDVAKAIKMHRRDLLEWYPFQSLLERKKGHLRLING